MRLIGLVLALGLTLTLILAPQSAGAQQTGKVLVYWLCRECGSAS